MARRNTLDPMERLLQLREMREFKEVLKEWDESGKKKEEKPKKWQDNPVNKLKLGILFFLLSPFVLFSYMWLLKTTALALAGMFK